MRTRYVLANVLHRPVRTVVSVLAISLEVLLILMVVGICKGIIVETAERQKGIGADIFLRPPNAPVILSAGGARMSTTDLDKLKAIKEIQAVTPVLMQLDTAAGWVNIYGIEYRSYVEVSGGFTFVAGGPFSSPLADEIIVDDLFQQSKRLKVGDEQELRGKNFKICGVVRHGKGARIFVPIETLQNMTGWTGQASMALVKCDTPASIDSVIAQMQAALPGYLVNSSEEFISLLTNNSPPGLDIFIRVVVGIAVIIGSFAIFLAMYTTISERTREIGILKSLGASKIYIVNLILRETVALSLVGTALGVVLMFAGKEIIESLIPTQMVLITFRWILIATALTLFSGVSGSIYPAVRAARKDPLTALDYE
ncbi:MAG: FtsX-like permease family protein [Terriglobia bacterium]